MPSLRRRGQPHRQAHAARGSAAIVGGGAGGLGGRVAAVQGDSIDDDAVAAAASMARTLGVFSIAVSATGVVSPSQPLVGRDGSVLSKETLRANFKLHVCGPFNLARRSAAAFAENEPDADGQRGVIVQTASISAFDGHVTTVPYAAANGAVVAVTLPTAPVPGIPAAVRQHSRTHSALLIDCRAIAVGESAGCRSGPAMATGSASTLR